MGQPTIAQPGTGEPAATVSRDAGTLVFRGALMRAAITGLWRQLQPLRTGRAGIGRPDPGHVVNRIDLSAVSRVDSAGLALLAALASAGQAGSRITVVGAPAGLAELRMAYRLDDELGFAR